jgi:SAM-dependent methyltransferase
VSVVQPRTDDKEIQMNYSLAYRIGFHPWEDAEEQPSFTDKFSALLDREESGRQPPYGPALDVGTGSGIWGIKLAQRGWQVTGVDIVDKALRRARDRVREAGVDMRLVQGDVTELRATKIGTGFRLVLDTGTFHGLTAAEREAMGREVSAIAAPDATVLMIAWAPKRRGPLPRGVSRSEIEAAFPGWNVTEVGESGFEAPKPVELLMKPEERWYRLLRR